uniref:Olfactory receptor n=1 Tax=Laticauda laticaudata TaxID=8630 RepID=A0A8C5SWJ9_LATLA
MGEENITLWTEFVLAGLRHLKSPIVFVGVINSMFVIALIGNSLFLFLIKVDSRIHIPIYAISLYGCTLQIFVTLALGGAECLILATMAYDRYVAICRPLQFPVLLSGKICCIMSLCTWFWSCVQALVCFLYVLPLPYCKTNIIIQNLCEYPALLQLSYSDNSAFEKAVYLGCLLLFLIPISVIFASYLAILLQVLRMTSIERSYKALGTCLSHLCVVGFFYGAAILTHMIPISSYSTEKAVINSVFTTIFPPMINPFIYSLRNQDVLAAFRKVIAK